MPDAWKKWEGQIVNGEFPLLQYLGGTEHGAVFLSERLEGDRPLRAAVKLIRADRGDDELQLSQWRMAAELSHPHLISLFDTGRCELGSVQLLYAVMECAEENLAEVLPGRALTPDEARAVLESVLDALAYLHAEGFVHGHIKPVNIIAIGNQLKVSSDGLLRAGEGLHSLVEPSAYHPPEIQPGVMPKAEAISAAGDVWSLGMTLVETLTQNLPVARTAEQLDPLLSQSLPEPFLDIARHCLVRHPRDRWTVAQITARLQGCAPVIQGTIQASQVHTPASAPRPFARQPKPAAKRQSYAVPIAVGSMLGLAAVLAGPRLLRRHSEAPRAPSTALVQLASPPPPKKASQPHPTTASTPSTPGERLTSTVPAPVPASIHPEAIHEEETNAVMKQPAGAVAQGEVAQQVLPDVLQSARDTIRGTVRVSVEVDVNRAGSVDGAELVSPGVSRYFARVALQAAQRWRFMPPKVAGGSVLSTWTLQFEFTRAGTRVVATQEMP